jgi:hypothetical protein
MQLNFAALVVIVASLSALCQCSSLITDPTGQEAIYFEGGNIMVFNLSTNTIKSRCTVNNKDYEFVPNTKWGIIPDSVNTDIYYGFNGYNRIVALKYDDCQVVEDATNLEVQSAIPRFYHVNETLYVFTNKDEAAYVYAYSTPSLTLKKSLAFAAAQDSLFVGAAGNLAYIGTLDHTYVVDLQTLNPPVILPHKEANFRILRVLRDGTFVTMKNSNSIYRSITKNGELAVSSTGFLAATLSAIPSSRFVFRSGDDNQFFIVGGSGCDSTGKCNKIVLQIVGVNKLDLVNSLTLITGPVNIQNVIVDIGNRVAVYGSIDPKDGLLHEIAWLNFRTGAFLGSQPDPESNNTTFTTPTTTPALTRISNDSSDVNYSHIGVMIIFAVLLTLASMAIL